MEDNKIDINSLIGFFLIGLIFIGWLYLNPPPPSTEVVQTIEKNEISDEKPVEQDLSDILSESKIDDYDDSTLNFENSLFQSDDDILVDAEKFIVKFSPIGGQISSLQLKGHLNYLGDPFNLFESNN